MKRKLLSISCVWVLVALSACDFSIPTSDEGLVDNTLTRTDTNLAKLDTTVGLVDSMPSDQTDVKEVPLPPSQEVNTGKVHPEELMTFAESLKGVPYVYASTDPKVGFDCSGFITYVFNHFNIQVPRSSVDFTNVGKTIPVEQAKRGDIILFTGTDSTETAVGHMGLVVSNTDTLRFIHSTSGKAMGVTVTPLNSYYQKRFIRTLRIFPQNGAPSSSPEGGGAQRAKPQG